MEEFIVVVEIIPVSSADELKALFIAKSLVVSEVKAVVAVFKSVVPELFLISRSLVVSGVKTVVAVCILIAGSVLVPEVKTVVSVAWVAYYLLAASMTFKSLISILVWTVISLRSISMSFFVESVDWLSVEVFEQCLDDEEFLELDDEELKESLWSKLSCPVSRTMFFSIEISVDLVLFLSLPFLSDAFNVKIRHEK